MAIEHLARCALGAAPGWSSGRGAAIPGRRRADTSQPRIAAGSSTAEVLSIVPRQAENSPPGGKRSGGLRLWRGTRVAVEHSGSGGTCQRRVQVQARPRKQGGRTHYARVRNAPGKMRKRRGSGAQAIQARQAQAAKASAREPRTVSPSAQLQERLASLPVIEQAKGVLMAQQRCDADQAFDLLCRAARRSSLPVRELAEQIVKKAQQRGASN
jgi:hypothetical protein